MRPVICWQSMTMSQAGDDKDVALMAKLWLRAMTGEEPMQIVPE